MTHVLGRTADGGPSGQLGTFLARDGSAGAPVSLDLDRPHVGLLAGKRGSGKSYTLGVIAENLANAPGVTGVVLDPMGVFAGLEEGGRAQVVSHPTIPPTAIPPRGWCALLDLDPTSAPGALLWRVAEAAVTLDDMRRLVDRASVPRETSRAVLNHLSLADSWGVFDPQGLTPRGLLDDRVTVVETAGLAREANAAVTYAVAEGLYDIAMNSTLERLPWILIDEAHTVTDTVASRALETILTRGRHPGVSLVLATQRPAALPPVAVSQADLLISHRLTSTADIEALAAARPTYLQGGIADSLPDGVGQAVIVDDATESAVTVSVRERETPHGGASPRASTRNPTGPTDDSNLGGRASP
ncbi:MAG: ATP-binding protein [Halodesulfurarchaeum sp.]